MNNRYDNDGIVLNSIHQSITIYETFRYFIFTNFRHNSPYQGLFCNFSLDGKYFRHNQ